MDIIQTAILAIVQGVTELLPVSSSGHLILLSNVVFSKPIPILLLTSLHLGTTLAILFTYREFFFTNIFKQSKLKTFFYIAIATIPAAVLGILFKDAIEQKLHSNFIIIMMLVLVGVLMIIFENLPKFKNPKIRKWEDINLWQAVLIGIGQSLALIPGTSRSGATTLVAMVLGVEKFKAIEYSFILGTPILLGSFLYSMASTENSVSYILSAEVLLGVLLSALTGYLAITILKRFSKKNFLTVFGLYRILLGIALAFTIL